MDTTELLFHFSPGDTLGLVIQASTSCSSSSSLPPRGACPPAESEAAFLQSLRGTINYTSEKFTPYTQYLFLTWKVKVAQSCLTIPNPMDIYSPWNSLGQTTGVGSLSLLQGIFPTQGSNTGLPHCRQILYQLSHKGKPRILKWVAYPFSSRSFRTRNRTGVSYIAGRFFTN